MSTGPPPARILLAGYTYNGLSVFALTLNGTWDNSFGQNGVAGGFDPWNGTNRAELLVLPNGDIIAAGNYIGDNAQGIGNWNGVPQEWLLEEFTANGQPVASFGQSGAMYVNIGGGASECDIANAMALTANGQLLVGGAVFRNVNSSWTADWTLAAFSTGMTTTRQWFQHDANFNVTSIADSNGNVIQRYVYSPYGQQTVLNADWSVPTTAVANSVYGFQGGRYDAATGMNYFKARYDDSATGTWLTADPAGYVNGANRARFELNEPVDGLDPSGEGFWSWVAATVEGAIAGAGTGAATGAIGGAVLGVLAGGVGAIPGAVAGLVGGAIAGAIAGGIAGAAADGAQELAGNGPISAGQAMAAGAISGGAAGLTGGIGGVLGAEGAASAVGAELSTGQSIGLSIVANGVGGSISAGNSSGWDPTTMLEGAGAGAVFGFAGGYVGVEWNTDLPGTLLGATVSTDSELVGNLIGNAKAFVGGGGASANSSGQLAVPNVQNRPSQSPSCKVQ